MTRENATPDRFDGERTRREALKLLGGTAALTTVGIGSVAAQSSGESFTVNNPVNIETWDGKILFASLFEPTSEGPHPAMLMTHGFGGERADVRPRAEMYARNGYVVLTYDSRGFGQSEGTAHVDGPPEIKDAQRLITYLAGLDSVLTDGPSDPRIGMDGYSYGGGIQLLTAAAEGAGKGLPESADRLDAIVPRWAWNDLLYSLAPNGVLKVGWGALLLLLGEIGARDQGDILARLHGLAPELYEYYFTISLTGEVPAEAATYFKERSPAYATGLGSVRDITTPALFIQGWNDTLFTPLEPVRNGRALEAHSVPARYVFFEGGHTIPPGVGERQKSYNDAQALEWIETYVGGNSPTSVPELSYFALQSGDLYTADAFPPATAERRQLSLVDAGVEGDSTFIPNLTSQALGPAFDFPVKRKTEFIGVPRLSLVIEPYGTESHVFFGFYQVTKNGEEIGPFGQQITPVKVTESRRLELDLIPFQRRIEPGGKLRLRISTISTFSDGAADYRSSEESLGTRIYHSEGRPAAVTIPARLTSDEVDDNEGDDGNENDNDEDNENDD